MIPHKSKAFRCILDLSFNITVNGHKLNSVNDSTTKHAPPEAMTQLGHALKRIVALVADNWSESAPFYFSKLDIKDGFWRMAVNDTDAWNFTYVLPSLTPPSSDAEIELVVPNSLQMGWCESPPFFCSGTETARDIIQHLSTKSSLPSHKFESIMLKFIQQSPPSPHQQCPHIFEVFVDDFICAAQSSHHPTLQHLSRALLHGIHAIFPPPSITHHNGFDPISEGSQKRQFDRQ